MKIIFAITLLSVAAFAIGCKEQTTTQKIDSLKAETAEVAKEMEDYTFAQKSEFVQKMEKHLSEINRELDLLSAKVEASSDSAKAEAKPKLQALRGQADTLKVQLDEVRNADESTWDNVKASSRKAYESLKDGFQQTRQWLSDKIAP